MGIKQKTMYPPVDGNIDADRSDEAISHTLALKIELMTELAVLIDERKLKQVEAALILCITRPRVSDLINNKADIFTIDELVNMLLSTGKCVHMSVQ